PFSYLFLFTATSPTHFYTLSLHDALPILLSIAARRHSQCRWRALCASNHGCPCPPDPGNHPRTPHFLSAGSPARRVLLRLGWPQDRKSTRLNSSHLGISYAVFCLKKKNKS